MTTATQTAEARPGVRPLSLDDLFAEQQSLTSAEASSSVLTAVETFSRAHDAGTAVPDQERYYKSLIPATPPKPGQQYAFEVDLDACSGCKACVVACHSLNGLDENESWRDVGQLHGAPSENPLGELPVIQHVTTACHHCVDPGCLNGCPVNAYEKDPDTGIVRHLDDQCFGCQYCTLMCPYEVPKYHAGHGIVRKCDMCSDRLSAGEAPACVQACPHEAIKIRTVSVDAVKVTAAKADVCDVEPRGKFKIPNSPRVSHTLPTTVYKTKKLDCSKMEPVDLRTPQPAHAHLPLTAMLALSQIGAGGFVALAGYLVCGGQRQDAVVLAVTLVSFLIANAGLALATLHLGRPHLAFRAVLGWRHSWLSRETLAFGGFMPFAAGATAIAWLPTIQSWTGLTLPEWVRSLLPTAFWATSLLAALTGVAAVFTSVMIYVATQKPLWSLPRTSMRFGLTMLVGGAGILFAAAGLFSSSTATLVASGLAFAGLVAAKSIYDGALARLADGDRSDPLVRSAVLVTGPLRRMSMIRVGLAGAAAGVGLIGLVLPPVAVIAASLAFAGEFAERWLFFTAATGPKMPGQIQPGPSAGDQPLVAAGGHA